MLNNKWYKLQYSKRYYTKSMCQATVHQVLSSWFEFCAAEWMEKFKDNFLRILIDQPRSSYHHLNVWLHLSFKHTQQWHCPEQQIVCQPSAEKRQTNVAVVCIVFHPILHAKKIHINNHSNERKDDLPLSPFLRMNMMLSIIAPEIQCWQTDYLFRYVTYWNILCSDEEHTHIMF